MPQLHSGLMGGIRYQITNSVRLRKSATAYFGRGTVFGAPTDNKKWTLSLWVKRGELGTDQHIISEYIDNSNYFDVRLNTSNQLFIQNRVAAANLLVANTTAVFRDPSAWYHIHFIFDSANGTASNRNLLTVNGQNIALSANSGSGDICSFNKAGAANVDIGASHSAGLWATFDGLLSDGYFVDGSAVPYTSFGETNTYGVWVPKAYAGTYGNNGFHLDFKDANLTAGSNVGLGKDVSGKGNYWNTNNISVTAGVTYDSMVDTPTNNYATWNPIGSPGGYTAGELTAAALNLTHSTTFASLASTIGMSSGKWYWEITGTLAEIGLCLAGAAALVNQSAIIYIGSDTLSWGCYGGDGKSYTNGSGTTYGSSFTTTDVMSVAFDADTGNLYFAKNGQWGNGAGAFNQAWGGAASARSGLTSGPYFAAHSQTGGNTSSVNFGQRPFTYTPPAGYKALCTANQTITAPTASGTFTGNLNADGPFVWIGGVPSTLTINSNAVTFGTHADKTAGGFKLRTASASYNNTGSNTWSATFASPSTNSAFAHPQPAQGNP